VRFARLIIATLLFSSLLGLGSLPAVGYLSLGGALDPIRGLYASARAARPVAGIRGFRGDSTVSVEYDTRGVPHIFAANDLDAVRALGFVSARDRLFQMDFLQRVASGRLAEILGDGAVDTDRYLRTTGIREGAARNWERIYREAGVEFHLLQAFSDGVNAYLERLAPRDLPIEYRLLGFEPEVFSPLTSLLVAQLMNYDLTYEAPDDAYINVVGRYGRAAYDSLFPTVLPYAVPMVGDHLANVPVKSHAPPSTLHLPPSTLHAPPSTLHLPPSTLHAPPSPSFSGYFPGVGSNNWIVSGAASASGSPLLAGDMHLNLTLPPIWYEAHLNAPGLNVYGVTIPGSPVIIAGFNDSLAWAFTNSAADQIDHYLLRTDSSGTRYDFEGSWQAFDLVADTIRVRGQPPLVDTIRITRFGPVIQVAGQPIAVQWVGHKDNHIVSALYGMSRASNVDEFEAAVREWDSPMQNIAYADAQGVTRIRTTGFLPVRRRGDGCGLLDGTSRDGDWVGRVPFDAMPVVSNPSGFASSTNQRPMAADYYINCKWTSAFRSARINDLLSAKATHDVADMARYQSDIRSVAAELFVPLLETPGVRERLSTVARAAADTLNMWNFEMAIDRREPLLFARWMENLERLVWDEPAFAAGGKPHLSVLHRMIVEDPTSRWFDRAASEGIESAFDVLGVAFELAVGEVDDGESWGGAHRLTIRHVTRLRQLRPFWRGPFAFPGHDETLAPGREMDVVSGASWRMIVDLSTSPPTARGIFPGGQSGDPLSEFYETGLGSYLRFDYYDLRMTGSAGELGGRLLQLEPWESGDAGS